MVKIISPAEAEKLKRERIPGFVIESFNELLISNYNPNGTIILQEEVIIEIMNRSPDDISRNEIFDNGWIDVEPLFKENGWNVEYDKPGLGENYKARFIFTSK